MGQSRTDSETNGDFGRKSQIPRVFSPAFIITYKIPTHWNFVTAGNAEKL